VPFVTKEFLVRGAGLAALLVVLIGIFAVALRNDESVSETTGSPAVNAKNTAKEEFALGAEALNTGDFDRALARFSESIRLDPANASAFVYRGGIFFARGEHDQALADLSEAIRLDPRHVAAFVARGTIYSGRQQYDLALADFSAAIRLDPDHALSFNNRALVYRQRHEYDQAIADYAKAIRLMPHHNAPCGGLAWLLATCPQASVRDGRKAVELATRACEFTAWQDRIELETRAAACAECSDFPAAIQWQKKAIALVPGDPDRIEECQRRLKLYENGQPWREE
jgi:tetratricopeptide (TPR) repeat protein